MTDDAPRDGTRRQFLAGAATVAGIAIAGCSELPWRDDAGATVFSPGEAADVLAESGPSVEWPVPIQPAASTRAVERDRIDDLLSGVPESITSSAVPNGVVRESIGDRRDEAVEIRAEAADAGEENLFHALRDARDGREAARDALTTLQAVEAVDDREQSGNGSDADSEDGDHARDSLVDDLEDEHETADGAVRDRLETIAYTGDPTAAERRRAALYYAQFETDLTRVDSTLDRWRVSPTDTVVDLGEAAGELEFAMATTSVWDHCADRYEAELEDSVDLESDFTETIERSIEHAAEVDVPEQTGEEWYEAVGAGDLDDRSLEYVLWDAGRPVATAVEGMNEALTDGELGTGLYRALQFEQAHRAFDVVRDRIVDGEVTSPETVSAIRTEREAALDAASDAREAIEIDEPSLGAYVLAETLQTLEWVDDTVARATESDPDTNVTLGGEYDDYVQVRAELEVLPDAAEAFRGRLQSD